MQDDLFKLPLVLGQGTVISRRNKLYAFLMSFIACRINGQQNERSRELRPEAYQISKVMRVENEFWIWRDLRLRYVRMNLAEQDGRCGG